MLVAVLEDLPAIAKAFVLLAGAVSVGWAGHVFFSQQATVPDRLARIEASLQELTFIDLNSRRIALVETTLCTEEAKQIHGRERDRYCEIVKYIHEHTNGEIRDQP